MEKNLAFAYTQNTIKNMIDGEISRHAAFLRYQDGSPAYDSLVIHTNERPTLDGFIADAFRALLSRFEGDGKYEYDAADGDDPAVYKMDFYLPDFETDLQQPTADEIARYVTLSATANWLVYRSFAEYAKIVSIEAESSLLRIITFLRTRKFPIE